MMAETHLLAVRRAGRPFYGPHILQSTIFQSLLPSYDRLSKLILHLRQQLLDDLYKKIPGISDAAQRHRLIQIKREISNYGVSSAADLDLLDSRQRRKITTYYSHLRARDALLNDNRPAILVEFRTVIHELIQDQEFRLAVDYSCPWLLDAYRRDTMLRSNDFTKEERGIYAYAARFFSKANPFHIFATVAFPPHLGFRMDGECETVLDLSIILRLEQLLLPHVVDPYRKFLHLRSFFVQDGKFHFFIRDQGSLHRRSLRQNWILERIIEFSQASERRQTVGDCVEYIATALGATNTSVIEKSLRTLISHGVLVEYLVRDFDKFAPDLLGILPAYDGFILDLQDVHLTRPSRHTLIAVEKRLRTAVDGMGIRNTGQSHYVNAYSRQSTAPYEEAADRLSATLQALKPIFTLSSNFSNWSYVISNFLMDQVATHPGHRRPLMHLMTEFFRDSSAIIGRYQPSSHRGQEEQAALQAWMRRVGNCEGSLSDGQLADLINERPLKILDPEILCFNGPVDRRNGCFYPHNIFAGNRRYISRYLLGEDRRHMNEPPGITSILDVQLAAAHDHNRGYVRTMFSTGCGFDARCRHRFDHWIDPADIWVQALDGRPAYRDGRSGRLLRFHFLGFLLGQNLGTEYQLLLAHHADFYLNPFLGYGTGRALTIERIPPLFYRAVCLRREQWRLPREALQIAWEHPDILLATIRLRDLLRMAGIDFTDCYFQLLGAPGEGHKPRYLNLSNPLSVHAFRRAVRSAPSTATISIAKMEPSGSELFEEERRSYVTELMIEV